MECSPELATLQENQDLPPRLNSPQTFDHQKMFAAAEHAPSQSDHIQDRVGGGGFPFTGNEKCLAADVSPPASDPNFAFGDRVVDLVDSLSSFLSDDALWSPQCLTPNHSISQTIESPSSLCGSTISADKPECENYHHAAWGATATSDCSSLHEPSLGPCEEISELDPSVLKRLKRTAANRAAAKRSRVKRQAHQQKLELEVEQLGQAKAALSKQLENISRQFRDSVTIYRVLRSDVDAMRAEVKLAEERIAGAGPHQTSSSSRFSNQVQSRHPSSPHLLHPLNSCPVPALANVSPAVAAARGDEPFFTGALVSGVSAGFGQKNGDIDGGLNNIAAVGDTVGVLEKGIMGDDGIACVWPPQFGSLSK